MAEITTRRMKDLHLEIAKKWGIPATVLAGTTLGLGVTMMHASGYNAEQIIGMVRDLLSELVASPDTRGAS